MNDRLDDLEHRVSEIEGAMRGDLKGSPGIPQNIAKMMSDIYLPPDGIKFQLIALKEAITALTNSIRSKEDQAKGAAWVLRGAYGIICIAIGIVIKHYLK